MACQTPGLWQVCAIFYGLDFHGKIVRHHLPWKSGRCPGADLPGDWGPGRWEADFSGSTVVDFENFGFQVARYSSATLEPRAIFIVSTIKIARESKGQNF